MKKLLVVLMFSLFTLHSASISTMTCSGGTVTVNATAHGLIAQQGFSITGSNVTRLVQPSSRPSRYNLT